MSSIGGAGKDNLKNIEDDLSDGIFDAATETTLLKLPGLSIPIHDYIDLGYDISDRLETIVYKTGGASGTTVATLTITYIGATTRIDTVTKT